MLDSVLTRFGALDAVLAQASRHVISVAATPALLTLDDIHLRLGIASLSTGIVPPTERPSDRWFQLMRQLFPQDPDTGPGACDSADIRAPWAAAPRGIASRLQKASAKDRKVVCRLLSAAAACLLVEQMGLEENVWAAGRVYHRKPRPFALVPSLAVERLWRVTTSTSILLNHAELDLIDCLLQARYDAVFGYCHPGKTNKRHTPPPASSAPGDIW